MPRIDIHTTLGFAPKCKKHEIIVITRGATASLNFDLTSKVYKLENIDQLTYMFKQGNNIFAYDMIEYFMITEDTTVKAGKDYYERISVNIPESSGYKFVVKEDLPVGTVIPAGTLYEETILDDTETSENWQFNSHFSYVKSGEYSFITLLLPSSETLLFKPTEPDCNVQCEVAVRLNTDSLPGMHSTDAVVISEQHPIAVINSLFSQLTSADSSMVQTPIVSETTYCSESLRCNN